MKHIFDPDAAYQTLIQASAAIDLVKGAVVYPCSEGSLQAAVEAFEQNLIEPVLIGPEKQMHQLAEEHELAIDQFPVIDMDDPHQAAAKAVEMIRSGEAETIVKGSLHTDELLKPVVAKGTGLRTGRRISHVFAMGVESYHKPFMITDAAVNIYPDLMAKKDILQNAIDLHHVFNEFKEFDAPTDPKVAILSAVETINPAIQSTLDAANLCKMADRHQITGAIVDGPLAFDNAISLAAAQTKGIDSPVSGDADILLVPDLEAGNMLAKQLTYLLDATSAGILLGARCPIILTSRADGVRSRLGSCAMAVLMVEAKRRRHAHAPNAS